MLFPPVQQVLLFTSILQSFTKVDITDQNRDGVNGVRKRGMFETYHQSHPHR